MKKNTKKSSSKYREILAGSVTLFILLLLTAVVICLIGNKKTECNHSYRLCDDSVEATEFKVGTKHWECSRCENDYFEKENATVNLPQLYLNGDLERISKENAVMTEAEYYENDRSEKCYATIKYQGHTSMGFEKKNFTIKFFEEENESKKYKISFNGWEPTHKYCLKANYIDFSGSRNIVSSNIWSEVVAGRENLNDNISKLELKGGIDGYPVALFINDEYQGLYTFNIPKDEDTYDIADDPDEAMFVINSGISDAANFKGLLTEEDIASVYDLEYANPENSTWAYDSINRLIKFVMENDGDAFRAGISEYLDVDAAIDYLVTAYVLGLTDNFSKNMILLTYDGQCWIPNLYDLDTACGLIFDGTGYLNYDFSLPVTDDEGKILSGTDNLLWDRILNNFTEEFSERYFSLRADVLKTEKLINQYFEFMDTVPKECFEKEKVLYPEYPQSDISQKDQIFAFLTSRTEALDTAVKNFTR